MWFSVYTRIGLTTVVFGWSIYQFVLGNIGNGIFFVLLSLIVVATVFLNEAMMLAFLQIRKGNVAKAERYLNWIKKPEVMTAKSEAYYYFLKALIVAQTQSPGKAEGLFKKSLSKGLRMRHDQAVAKLNLAGFAASKRRKREAMNWLNEAKKLDDKKMLSDQIRMLKQQLARI